MWPLALAAIGLGTGIASGAIAARTSRDNAYSAYNTAQQNAAAAQRAALQNAQFTMSAGQATASMIGAAGRANAAMRMMTAQLNTKSLQALTLHNANVQRDVSLYNYSLLENELDELFEDYQLEDLYLRNTAARTEGSMIAAQAASGTVIGEGSNFEVMADSKTQAALDALVLRHNYDRQAGDINDAMARGLWEGQTAIANMRWEAIVEGVNINAQAALDASGILTQSALDAGSTMVNATAGAFSALSQGQAQATSYRSAGQAQYNQYMNQADQQFKTGILNGIGNAATLYAAAFSPSPTPSTVLSSQKVAPLAVNYQPSYNQPGTSLLT